MLRTLRRLLVYAKPYNKFLPKYIFVSVFALIFSTMNFILIIPLLNVIFEPEAYSAIPVLPETFSFSKEYLEAAFNLFMYNLLNKYGQIMTLFIVCIFVVVA
jgi:subfamily B ATP-binding cassette protein MsbA